MRKQHWTCADVIRLFRVSERIKSRRTLMNAEERGEIPKAERIERGRTQVRAWNARDLPSIGMRFGFLPSPQEQEVVSVYTAKGGVLKTTLAYGLARLLALHGIKTVIVG